MFESGVVRVRLRGLTGNASQQLIVTVKLGPAKPGYTGMPFSKLCVRSTMVIGSDNPTPARRGRSSARRGCVKHLKLSSVASQKRARAVVGHGVRTHG